MGLYKEFKKFAMRGNVIDLAVGVVIGGALQKIISSLVSDIIMPPIGFIIGGINFDQIKINLSKITAGFAPVTINIGHFIQTVLDFLIIAFCIFLVMKGMNKMKKNEEEKLSAPHRNPRLVENKTITKKN